MTVSIRLGDCLDVFANERNVPAFVSDPPANIGFMGRSWDGSEPALDYVPMIPARDKAHLREMQIEHSFSRYWAKRYAMAYDIADQHAVNIVWTLPRTSHQTANALRAAGWRIKDNLVHLFGTGWAKSGNALAPGQEGWLLCTKGKPDLDIDACRAPRGARDDAHRVRQSGATGLFNTALRAVESGGAVGGSLPKNALLSHCEECVRVGSKSVKSDNARSRGASVLFNNGAQSSSDTIALGYAENGTESVPAWHCIAGCVCGARSKWDPEKPLPRCPCGETWRWLCAVAEVNAQSGDSASASGLKKKAGSVNGTWGLTNAKNDVYGGHSDQGGASRFFNTFSHLSMANVPNDGTMNATQGGDSWNESANHVVCDSCRNARSNDSADTVAPDVASQRNEDRSESLTSNADIAKSSSEHSPETIQCIARENALGSQGEPNDQSAKYAASRVVECITSSAPNDAPILPDQEFSRHGLDSTDMRSGHTQNQCRVCGAVLPENIVTTTTTQSRETSNGSAPRVTSTSITWVSREEREYALTNLPSYKYLSKCSSSERHAGCENLYWRANKKNPFGFDQVTHAEWEALPTYGGNGKDMRESPAHRRHDGDVATRAQGNVHPTVKSYRLMHWLHSITGAKRILDFTAGSGTGMYTAALDGIDWLGAEICPEAIVIAESRHAFWSSLSPKAIAAFMDQKPMAAVMKTQAKSASVASA
jgi:hypothetical protein